MPFSPRTPFDWHLRTRSLALGKQTKIMAVLNVTPDSFFDGCKFFSINGAVEHALQLLDDGADILDIGGESTRPEATPLSPEEEQARVLPVLDAVLKERPQAIVSVDTFHAATARRAIEAGAEIVNDVSGMTWDPAMSVTCGELKCGVVLMHTRGTPQQWKALPRIPPHAVMPIVLTGLRNSILLSRTAGVESDRIVLDPGLGFGKIKDENYTILALLHQLHQFGLPVLSGSSRKGFLGRTLAPLFGGAVAAVEARLNATTSANVASILAGAHLLRVHDVRPALEAAAIADAVLEATAVIAESAGPPFAQHTSVRPQ